MSHDGSDISDEDAVLPAVGLLDDLDSDVDFSDEDDPALQEYSEADEEWKRRQKEAKGRPRVRVMAAVASSRATTPSRAPSGTS